MGFWSLNYFFITRLKQRVGLVFLSSVEWNVEVVVVVEWGEGKEKKREKRQRAKSGACGWCGLPTLRDSID